MMTVGDVIARILQIKNIKNDDESAHVMEDDLRGEVLREIADGNPNGRALAKAVLKTGDIHFARWCA